MSEWHTPQNWMSMTTSFGRGSRRWIVIGASGFFAADAPHAWIVCMSMLLFSETGHSFERFGIPRAFHFDLRCGLIDLAEIVARELDARRADVLFEAMNLRRARDRDHPRLLRENPCERNLRGRRLLALRDSANEIDDGAVRFARLGREAWEHVAEVRLVERGAFVDLPGEKPFAERAERHEADA